ncbi:MAG: carbohydrate ABC transporter permease [Clostridia bacterium]|nr:carbohydrate ABC transporter permease [Clostridia bacterium]
MSSVSGMRQGKSDRVVGVVSTVLIIALSLVFLYPVVYIVSLSFSDSQFVDRRMVWLLPMGFNVNAYRLAFRHEYLLGSYWNSVVYSVLGTVYSLALTIFGAYALSHKRLRGRGVITMIIFITMLFSGGLIPTFLLVRDLGMLNSLWAMILPCAVSQWSLIVMRTAFQQNPESIEESARIDGASHFQVMLRIVVPMSTPVIATMGLLYFVGKWNDYFQAMVYLSTRTMFPLQLIARELLVVFGDNAFKRAMGNVAEASRLSYSPVTFRSAIIVLTLAPLMAIYPFLQRYFVKGMTVGAVKG